MYTYNDINYGISFNNEGEYEDKFLTSFYKLFVEEFDVDSIEGFYLEIIKEAKSEGIEIKEEGLIKEMLTWIIKNKDNLDFSTYYHGSAMTKPCRLTFKNLDLKEIHQSDIDNFTWSKDYLAVLNKDLEKVLTYCKKTMPESLYDYLTKNSLVGINFLNVSS